MSKEDRMVYKMEAKRGKNFVTPISQFFSTLFSLQIALTEHRVALLNYIFITYRNFLYLVSGGFNRLLLKLN